VAMYVSPDETNLSHLLMGCDRFGLSVSWIIPLGTLSASSHVEYFASSRHYRLF